MTRSLRLIALAALAAVVHPALAQTPPKPVTLNGIFDLDLVRHRARRCRQIEGCGQQRESVERQMLCGDGHVHELRAASMTDTSEG